MGRIVMLLGKGCKTDRKGKDKRNNISFPFLSYTQTMDFLKKLLAEYDVAFTEKVFTTTESIDGLMPEPFVSSHLTI